MGAAAYNRGSKRIRRSFDGEIETATRRASVRVEREVERRLREEIGRLQQDMKRARRCIAELRRSKEAIVQRTQEEQSRSDAAIRMLTRIAFPNDRAALAGKP